jgi:hypothetical protein
VAHGVERHPEDVYKAAREGLNRRLSGTRCPDHGQQARVVGTGTTVDFEEPCCDKLTAMTKQALNLT